MTRHGDRLWGGRFGEQPSEAVLRFMSGRDVEGLPPCDEALIPYDLATNRAHATMLGECGIIPTESARLILDGLAEIEAAHAAGEFRLDPTLEDVHTNIERELARRIGEEHAAHLHTGRSRNDQILCDMRLWERDATGQAISEARALGETLLELACAHAETIMPGFTHHQHATVTTLGHVLLGFAPGLVRTVERLVEWRRRFDRCPLGSVTGYGTTLPINRERVAELLGFGAVDESSLDPVQTRGEPEAELAGVLELALLHLASLAGSLILLATEEFQCISIADAYSSGSSVMPQKRNPDSLEVVKGRAAAVSGLAAALRGLQARSLFGYNREQQWSKYLIMDAVRESLPCFAVVRGVLGTMRVNSERMSELARRGFLGATALVEALCSERGLAFRNAKELVERAVALSAARGLEYVDGNCLRAAAQEAGIALDFTCDDVARWQEPERVLPRLSHTGGPAPEAVRHGAEALRERLRAAL